MPEGRDIQVPTPEAVRRANLINTWTSPRLSELLVWVLAGLFTEEEKKALSGSH